MISAEADGELNQRDQIALETHLSECAACRRERVRLSAVRKALSAWQEPEPSGSLTERFVARLQREPRAPEAARRSLFVFPRVPAWGLASAAAAALLVAVYVGMPPRLQRPEPARDIAATPRVTREPAQESPTAPATVKPTVPGPAFVLKPRPKTYVAQAGAGSHKERRHRIRVAKGNAEAGRELRVSTAAASALTDSARAAAETELADSLAKMKTMMASAIMNTERAIMSPAPASAEVEAGSTPESDEETSGSI